MDSIYSNCEIVFSDLGKKQEAGFFKGAQNINANAVEVKSGGKQSSTVEHTGSSSPSAKKSGAPCRCSVALLVVLCLALLGGVIALGILYIHKGNRSDDLENENSKLSASLSSVEQRLVGTERKLEDLQLRYKNVSDMLTTYRDIKRNLEDLQVKHRDLLKNVSQCNAKDGTVCLNGWKKHRGSCFLFSTEKMNWVQSQETCRSKGAHLVMIKTQEKQDFVLSGIRETHWMGLSDWETEGKWVWVDNSPLHNQHWWTNEPDNWTGGGDPNGEDCAAVGDENGNIQLWFDASCEKRKKFICETLPRI